MNAETHYLAVDLGATSGRTILATFDGSKVEMRELTRFKHPMVPMGGHLYWDLPHLYNDFRCALRFHGLRQSRPAGGRVGVFIAGKGAEHVETEKIRGNPRRRKNILGRPGRQ